MWGGHSLTGLQLCMNELNLRVVGKGVGAVVGCRCVAIAGAAMVLSCFYYPEV